MVTRSLLAVLMVALGTTLLFAQEPPAPPKSDGTNGAASDGPPAQVDPDLEEAQAKFEAVVAEWKEGLKEIRSLQVEYQEADAQERAQLEQQFQEYRERLQSEVQPRLIAAAEAAYRANPEKNADVAKFLIMIVQEFVYGDRFEDAKRLCDALEEGGADMPQLDLLAGVADFATNHFQQAEEHLEKASEAGQLTLPQSPKPTEFRKHVVRLAQSAQAAIAELNYQDLCEREQEIRAAEAKADDLPRVKLETTAGDIVVELFENEAPNTVANFVYLVEKGFYDETPFHRVLPGFMAQGGDPEGTGRGGPGYTIRCECLKEDHRKHFRGSLSMAKQPAPHTGGSQFFLTFLPTPHLNGQHTVFGRVIDGMGVLAKLQRTERQEPGAAAEPDQIVKATVLRKRDHEYKPQTSPPLVD